MDSKFKPGDILKFEDGMRAIVANAIPQVTNSNEYLYYLWSWYKGAIDWDSFSESELVDKVKIMGHTDISLLVGYEEENEKKFKVTEPVYEYAVEGKPIGKIISKEICDDGLKVTISTENVREENEKLKNEIETLKEALDRQKHDNDIWRQGWFECLKSVGYYLNS